MNVILVMMESDFRTLCQKFACIMFDKFQLGEPIVHDRPVVPDVALVTFIRLAAVSIVFSPNCQILHKLFIRTK